MRASMALPSLLPVLRGVCMCVCARFSGLRVSESTTPSLAIRIPIHSFTQSQFIIIIIITTIIIIIIIVVVIFFFFFIIVVDIIIIISCRVFHFRISRHGSKVVSPLTLNIAVLHVGSMGDNREGCHVEKEGDTKTTRRGRNNATESTATKAEGAGQTDAVAKEG